MKQRVARWLSLLPSVHDYAGLRQSWRGDLLAGLTVGIVALPLALAFGVSSGAGAEAGLVTAIVAGIVAAVFGGSNIQVSGPTGAMVVVLGPIIAAHGVEAVALVSILGGLIVLVAGILRLGRLVTIIPWPVIEGFTLGIAVIIFLQQVPSALGAPVQVGANAVVGAVHAVGDAEPVEALWGIAAVAVVAAIMALLPRVHRAIPASLLGIAVVTIVVELAGLPLARIGELPASLPTPSIPDMDAALLQSMILPAFAIAALAAIESLLSARVGAGLADTGTFDADRELVGQGLASIAAGLFGGMPATGAIARTAVAVRSGARTRLASIVHALVLLLVVLVGAQLVGRIPLAALAGVLMVTTFRMVAPATVRAVLRASRSSAAVFVITAVVTIAFDLVIAVGIGLAVAVLIAVWSLARSGAVTREELPGEGRPGDERIALIRLDGALFFASAENVLEQVRSIGGIEVVILRMSQLGTLDATGARVIVELVTALERRGVTVLVKGIQPQHLELARRVGVLGALRHGNHIFDDLDSALAHARTHVARAV